MGLLTFICVLSVMIFVHELGHFLAARYFGVTVHTFSIGFGKVIYAKFYKGTKWQIALIPLGGYVQMKGQDDTKPLEQNSDHDSYNAKKPWQRIIILLAGAFANFALAIVLFFSIALIGTQEIAPKIGSITPNSPAHHRGLQPNDTIISIQNKPVASWSDIAKIISAHDGVLEMVIERNGIIQNFSIATHMTTTQNIFGEFIQKPMIGIAPAHEVVTVNRNIFEATFFAFEKTFQAGTLIFQSLLKLVTGVVPSSELGSVISIGKVISDASMISIVALLSITALVSVNLGVVNLLPIPALDGGHIMFNLYEIITKKKPNEKILLNLTILGWIFLGGLMLFGIYNDVNRFFG